jgi:hypothetical protein
MGEHPTLREKLAAELAQERKQAAENDRAYEERERANQRAYLLDTLVKKDIEPLPESALPYLNEWEQTDDESNKYRGWYYEREGIRLAITHDGRLALWHQCPLCSTWYPGGQVYDRVSLAGLLEAVGEGAIPVHRWCPMNPKEQPKPKPPKIAPPDDPLAAIAFHLDRIATLLEDGAVATTTA